MMKKQLLYLLYSTFFLVGNIYSQSSCDEYYNASEASLSIGELSCDLEDDLSYEDKTIAARDKVSLTAGFSISNTSGNTLTIKTDHTIIPDEYTYSTNSSFILYKLYNETYCNLHGTDYMPLSLKANQAGPVKCIGNAVGGPAAAVNVSSTGALNYSMTFDIPAGSNGMEPTIGIAYDSQSGSGVLGYGFSLTGIPSIVRTTKNNYYDGEYAPVTMESITDDALMFNGKRLIVNTETATVGTTIFYPENDPYTKIYYSAKEDKFIVQYKNGTTMILGNNGMTNNAVFKNASGTYAWGVSRIIDINGNYINFSYIGNSTTGEYNISTITYTGNTGISPYASIYFYYDKKDDKNSIYIAGSRILRSNLLTSVKTFYDNALYSSYDFTYFNDTYSKMRRMYVTKEGMEYNSTLFNWTGEGLDLSTTESEPSSLTSRKQEDDTLYFGAFEEYGKYEIISWDGEYDITTPYGTITVPISQTDDSRILDIQIQDWDDDRVDELIVHCIDGDYDYIYVYEIGDSGISYDIVSTLSQGTYPKFSYSHYYADINNDGRVDRITTKNIYNTCSVYYLCRTDEVIEVCINDETYSIENVGAMYLRFIDFDGDGKLEMLAFDEKTQDDHYTSPPEQILGRLYSFDESTMSFTEDDRMSERFFGWTGNVFFGDFNGDGKSDYIRYYDDDNTTPYWDLFLGTGTGFTRGVIPDFFSGKSIEPRDDDNNDLYIEISDLNNDGKSDIVYTYRDFVYVLMTQGVINKEYNYNLATYDMDLPTYTGSYDDDNMDAVITYCVDLDNDGQKEIIYGHNYPESNTDITDESYRLLTFNTPPHTAFYVSKITDGYGIQYIAEYSPESIIGDYIPAYVPTGGTYIDAEVTENALMVSNLTKKDYFAAIELSNTSYSYWNRQTRLRNREFLGFTNVIAYDEVSNTETMQRYKYYLPDYEDIKSAWLYSETKIKNDNIISYTINTLDQVFSAETESDKCFYPYIQTKKEVDKLTTYTTTTSVTMDAAMGMTEKEIVTSDGWEKTENYSYTNVDDNIYRLDEITTAISNGSEGNTSSIEYEYGDSDFPLRVTEKTEKGITTTYNSFDDYGNPTEVTESASDAASRTKSCTFDSQGRFLTSTTDENGRTAYETHDLTDGKLAASTDINNLTTEYEYEFNGNEYVITTTHPSGRTTKKQIGWSYDVGLYYVEEEQYDGNVITKCYDILKREVKEETLGYEGASLATTYTYNDDGTLAEMTVPGIETAKTYTYYDDGRLHTETGQNHGLTYSYSGAATTTTDNVGSLFGVSGTSKTKTYNAAGDITAMTDMYGNSITHTYKIPGLLATSATLDQTVSMEYDETNLTMTQYTDADMGTYIYTYNGFGQQLTRTDNIGNVNTNTYYDDGLIQSQATTGEGATISYTYGDEEGTYNLPTEISRVSNAGGTAIDDCSEQYSYDRYGRLETEISRISDNEYTTEYTYTDADLVETISYPTGLELEYQYDDYGNITSIINTGDQTAVWEGVSKNDMQQWTEIALGNGLYTDYTYDENFYINTIQTGTESDPASVQDLEFCFSNTGNLSPRLDALSAGDGSVLMEKFKYDKMSRMYRSDLINSGSYHLSAFKTNGNIDSTSTSGSYSYANFPVHAVASLLGPYGSMAKRSSYITTTEYNSDNKIILLENDLYKIIIGYGVNGQRNIMETYYNDLLQTTKIYVDNSEFIYDADGTLESSRTFIEAPSGLCAVYEKDADGNESIHYVHTDYQGSVLLYTNENGKVESDDDGNEYRYSYDAWGRPRDPETWELLEVDITDALVNLNDMQPRFDRGYTGHEMLCGFGLINMNGRLYDPYLQRFLSPDLYIQDDENSQNYNKYSYCMNNPLKYTDPTGYLTDPSSGVNYYAGASSFYQQLDYMNYYTQQASAIAEAYSQPGYSLNMNFSADAVNLSFVAENNFERTSVTGLNDASSGESLDVPQVRDSDYSKNVQGFTNAQFFDSNGNSLWNFNSNRRLEVLTISDNRNFLNTDEGRSAFWNTDRNHGNIFRKFNSTKDFTNNFGNMDPNKIYIIYNAQGKTSYGWIYNWYKNDPNATLPNGGRNSSMRQILNGYNNSGL